MDALSHPPLEALALTALLDRAAARFAHHPAMLFNGRRWSYAALAALVERAAAGLQRLHIGPGARVGLCLPNTPYSVILYYAVLKAGAVVVNFNPLYVTAELRKQIADSATTTLIVPDVAAIYDKAAVLLNEPPLARLIVCPIADMLPLLKGASFSILQRKSLAHPGWTDRIIPYRRLLDAGSAPRPVAIDPHGLAVLQYTGGTTGLPKAAMLTHANLTINAQQVLHHMPSLRPGEEKMMAVLPFFHVFAMTSVLNAGIAMGAEIILHTRFEIEAVLASIVRDRPTIFNAVPTIYNALATQAEKRRLDISSLRVCVSGGAPLPAEVRERFERLTGGRLTEGYGLTEAGPVVACNPPDGDGRPGSVGTAMQDTGIEIRALDDITQTVPNFERGEICVRGPQVMRGYLNRDDETRATFVAGALRTGDVGYLDDDGYLFVTDRLKDVIICSGYNVYPRVIEDALYEHPAVAEAIVIGIADDYRGQAPLAFVTLRDGHAATGEALAAFLRSHISAIEQPKRVEIRKSLPKTAVGKLSRKELVAEYQS